MITPSEIEKNLKTILLGRKIFSFDILDSTNNQAKKNLDEPEGTIFVCEEQTAGRGRLARKWISPYGKGIWLSVLLKPKLSLNRIPMLTHLAAAAVYCGLKNYGIESKIKWPNDIIIQDKKICGILCESIVLPQAGHAVIVGIGINVNLEDKDIPLELRNKVTSIRQATGRILDRNSLIAGILNSLEYFYRRCFVKDDFEEVLAICRSKSCVLGREIRLIPSKEIDNPADNKNMVHALGLDIDHEGRLLAEIRGTGETIKLVSGEVSVRVEDGYI